MKEWILLHLMLCSFGLFITKASAQALRPDTGLINAAVSKANTLYTKAIGEQLPLNNGPEYYFYNPLQFKGSAYFMDATYTSGSVYYDDAEYKNVSLLYDLYKDQLVSVLFDQYSKYGLLNERVQNFDLLGHHFININADSLIKNTVLKTGYYDELYHGNTQILCKRYKTIQNYNSTTGSQESYQYFTSAKEDFFVRKNNVYYKVGGKGELLDILKDKEKLLRQYIKANKIKFKDEGAAFANVAAYYDHTTN
jgi:hypothetical protein